MCRDAPLYRRRRRGSRRGRRPHRGRIELEPCLVALSQASFGGVQRLYLGCFIWSCCARTSSAPRVPEQTDARQAFIPVQTLHLFDRGGWSPWVPAIVGKRNPSPYGWNGRQTRPKRYRCNSSRTGTPIAFSACSRPTTHLLGPQSPGQRIFLLGSDRLGRDQWSRIMHGTQTSMTVGPRRGGAERRFSAWCWAAYRAISAGSPTRSSSG